LPSSLLVVVWKTVQWLWRNGRNPKEAMNPELWLLENAFQPARGGCERRFRRSGREREGRKVFPIFGVKVVDATFG